MQNFDTFGSIAANEVTVKTMSKISKESIHAIAAGRNLYFFIMYDIMVTKKNYYVLKQNRQRTFNLFS